ncbi:hypothetical protein DFR86_01645 [Acidianus sulfidivorans JP7]|uniref:Cobalt ABC transporter permease n=1 Tax=Acidianus sulfidivorans JP7 TaxID=619593 RepID=A0A2U9IK25_9CREN|nr:hypothetical protein [Acidianus sulfidivorans]AWR96378.1 hypothetical protein DFR86_01645 [Acidianus sulfidivorans JP7]
MIISTYISVGLIAMIVSIAMLVKRRAIFVAEIIISLISYFILFYTHRLDFYIFTIRAFVFINLYFILSGVVDKSTILDLLGEKGVPIVVALAYYPYFYQLSTEVTFYAKARKIGFNIIKISKPIIIELIRVAENLYIAYSVKLFGKYTGKKNYMPNKDDIFLIIIGATTLCLSLILPFQWVI